MRTNPLDKTTRKSSTQKILDELKNSSLYVILDDENESNTNSRNYMNLSEQFFEFLSITVFNLIHTTRENFCQKQFKIDVSCRITARSFDQGVSGFYDRSKLTRKELNLKYFYKKGLLKLICLDLSLVRKKLSLNCLPDKIQLLYKFYYAVKNLRSLRLRVKVINEKHKQAVVDVLNNFDLIRNEDVGNINNDRKKREKFFIITISDKVEVIKKIESHILFPPVIRNADLELVESEDDKDQDNHLRAPFIIPFYLSLMYILYDSIKASPSKVYLGTISVHKQKMVSATNFFGLENQFSELVTKGKFIELSFNEQDCKINIYISDLQKFKWHLIECKKIMFFREFSVIIKIYEIVKKSLNEGKKAITFDFDDMDEARKVGMILVENKIIEKNQIEELENNNNNNNRLSTFEMSVDENTLLMLQKLLLITHAPIESELEQIMKAETNHQSKDEKNNEETKQIAMFTRTKVAQNALTPVSDQSEFCQSRNSNGIFTPKRRLSNDENKNNEKKNKPGFPDFTG